MARCHPLKRPTKRSEVVGRNMASTSDRASSTTTRRLRLLVPGLGGREGGPPARRRQGSVSHVFLVSYSYDKALWFHAGCASLFNYHFIDGNLRDYPGRSWNSRLIRPTDLVAHDPLPSRIPLTSARHERASTVLTSNKGFEGRSFRACSPAAPTGSRCTSGGIPPCSPTRGTARHPSPAWKCGTRAPHVDGGNGRAATASNSPPRRPSGAGLPARRW